MNLAKVFTSIAVLASFVLAFRDDDYEVFPMEDFEAPRIFFMLTICFSFAILVNFVIRTLHLPLSESSLLMFFGCLMGIGMEYDKSKFLAKELSLIYTDPRFVLGLYYPVVLFKLAISIDVHTFTKSIVQIGLLSTVGMLLQSVMVGSVMLFLINNKESFPILKVLMYGMLTTSTFPSDATRFLDEKGPMNKHMINILEGECAFGIVTYSWILGILTEIQKSPEYLKDTNPEVIALVFWVIFKFIAGGCLFGFVGGIFLTMVVKAFQGDLLNILAITLVLPMFLNYIFRRYLFISGVLVVLITGFILNKAQISTKVKKNILDFHEMISYIAHTLISFLAGVHVTYSIMVTTRKEDYAIVLVLYVFSAGSRLISFIILSPLLSRTGYGWTVKDLIVAWIGGLRGSHIYFMAILTETVYPDLGLELLLHSFTVVFLTTFINLPLLALLLKILGLSDVPKSMKINMNSCINQLMTQREKKIYVLKTDRFLADANWPLIQEKTIIKNPFYKEGREVDDEFEENFILNKAAVCPDCLEEVKREPTKKEFEEMVREARIRVLKTRKVCYLKQYETGMLTKVGLSVLSLAIETALDSDKKLIEMEGLFKMFRQKGIYFKVRKICMRLLTWNRRPPPKEPRKPVRRFCYRIMRDVRYQVVMGVIILLHLIAIHIEHFILLNVKNDAIFYTLLISKFGCLILYILETVIKILGSSFIYIKEGLRLYFTSFFNVMDFAFTIVLLMSIITLLLVHNGIYGYSDTFILVVFYLKYLRWFGLQRSLRLLAWIIVKFCEYRIESRLSVAYDLGKAFLSADEEIVEKMDSLIDNKAVQDIIIQQIDLHKLDLARELGLLQENRPWMSITLKSKQALKATLNNMKDAIFELKEHGWADANEYHKLMESLEERYAYLRSVKRIDPNPPEDQFRELNWLIDDDYIADYLLTGAQLVSFKAGEVLGEEGGSLGGIYLVITGIIKITYIPCPELLQRIRDFGILPSIDCITSSRFDKKFEEFINAGNSFGELPTCCGRPLNANYVACTDAKLYFLSKRLVLRAIELSGDGVYGLEARMWKFFGLKLAQSILSEVPSYQYASEEKIKLLTGRAIVPKIDYFKVFVVTEMVENVILLEGVAMDYNTKLMYKAPCYIPRNVQKMFLPKSSQISFAHEIETRLFIIPMSGIDGYEVMLEEQFIADFDKNRSIRSIFDTMRANAFKGTYRKTNFEIIHRRVRKRNRGSDITVSSVHSRKSVHDVDFRRHSSKKQSSAARLKDELSEKELASEKISAPRSEESIILDKMTIQFLKSKSSANLDKSDPQDNPEDEKR